jgi:hypothetical protein
MTDKTNTNRWLVLVIVCVAQFMVVLDATIVNVALPSIQSGLHFSASSLQWIVNAYTLVFGGFLLLGGRAADLFLAFTVGAFLMLAAGGPRARAPTPCRRRDDRRRRRGDRAGLARTREPTRCGVRHWDGTVTPRPRSPAKCRLAHLRPVSDTMPGVTWSSA